MDCVEFEKQEERKEMDFIFNNFHTCEAAMMQWNPDWIRCPVCHGEMDENGFYKHKNPILMRN